MNATTLGSRRTQGAGQPPRCSTSSPHTQSATTSSPSDRSYRGPLPAGTPSRPIPQPPRERSSRRCGEEPSFRKSGAHHGRPSLCQSTLQSAVDPPAKPRSSASDFRNGTKTSGGIRTRELPVSGALYRPRYRGLKLPGRPPSAENAPALEKPPKTSCSTTWRATRPSGLGARAGRFGLKWRYPALRSATSTLSAPKALPSRPSICGSCGPEAR
jgi:hypothetical protein